MAEKRKPRLTMLLRKRGKRKSIKIELFEAHLWPKLYAKFGSRGGQWFRIRINGRWFDTLNSDTLMFYTFYKFRDMLWRSIKKSW